VLWLVLASVVVPGVTRVLGVLISVCKVGCWLMRVVSAGLVVRVSVGTVPAVLVHAPGLEPVMDVRAVVEAGVDGCKELPVVLNVERMDVVSPGWVVPVGPKEVLGLLVVDVMGVSVSLADVGPSEMLVDAVVLGLVCRVVSLVVVIWVWLVRDVGGVVLVVRVDRVGSVVDPEWEGPVWGLLGDRDCTWEVALVVSTGVV
jgi:hypothetical protein